MAMTQIELEHKMYGFGKYRAQKAISSNEDEGRAHNNPYMQELYRRYVFPLAALVAEDIRAKKPGRNQAHVTLLRGMDEEAIAFLTIRAVLGELLSCGTDGHGVRSADQLIGKGIMHEQHLAVFEHEEPALFHTLVHDFERKLSKSDRHRMTVIRMQAKKNGIELPEWGVGSQQQVGQYLLHKCQEVGLIDVYRTQEWDHGKQKVMTYDGIHLSSDARSIVSRVTHHVVEMGKFACPCVEQPKDWTSLTEGGFHTKEMRRVFPFCVQAAPTARDYLQENPAPEVLSALSRLQAVRWKINGAVLDLAKQIARHFDVDEILSMEDFPAPKKPDWLADQAKEDMTPEQLAEFASWKREMSEWHTQVKLRGTKWGRFTTAMRVATEFVEYPAIHFVYFADFRGRLYCRTTGVSPQGSDLQKALLHFADGKKLSSPDAVRWFKIDGANRWGWDKLPLDERARKVDEHRDLFLRMADDPISHNEWREADVPMQFLAWVLEYAAWCRDPVNFESRIAVGMDGSCNGLQNFSAMLRDEVGGKATNLVPGDKPNDIYGMVAEVTQRQLSVEPDDDAGFRKKWLAHGMNRTLVKRSVMTLPYGSTRFSCAEFIVGDYLKMGKAVEFARDEYQASAQFLSHFVWDSIGHVVVKAREAMDWLQQCSTDILKEGEEEILWITPTGFPVLQHYWEVQEHRIRTRLHGNALIKVRSEKDTPCRRAHRNGIAPNFVHSMDASHLCRVTNRCSELGIGSLAMIHDDYGTHAADAAVLYKVIREEFVKLYSDHDPLAEFKARYPYCNEPPAKGNLNLQVVLDSPYFFS